MNQSISISSLLLHRGHSVSQVTGPSDSLTKLGLRAPDSRARTHTQTIHTAVALSRKCHSPIIDICLFGGLEIEVFRLTFTIETHL